MSWDVRIAKRVSKQMKRISKKEVPNILGVMDNMARNPYWGDIKKIEGEQHVWRRRVGNYRILYEIFPNEKFVAVLDIRRRTTTTYHRK